MDKNMTLEKRIAAELYSYQGKMSVFVDDLHGHTVEIGADEEFETASTIKAYILAALYPGRKVPPFFFHPRQPVDGHLNCRILSIHLDKSPFRDIL